MFLFYRKYKLLVYKYVISSTKYLKYHPKFTKISHRSDHYLSVLYKDIYGQDTYSKKHVNCIHRMFKITKVNSRLISDDWWLDVLLLVKSDAGNGKFDEDLERIVSNIPEHDFKKMTVYECLEIHSFFLLLSFFDIAYEIRELAKKRAYFDVIGSNKFDYNSYKLAISAAIEDGDFDLVNNLASKTDKSTPLYKCASRILSLFHYKDNNTSDHVFQYDNYEPEKLIFGKDVAVVGPLVVNRSTLDEIKSFEVLVGFNIKSNIKEKINEYKDYEVSYYNKLQSGYIINNKNIEIPSNIKLAIFKNIKPIGNIFSKDSSRVLKQVEVLFNGSLTAVPNAIIDLLSLKPRRIKLYGMDLALSQTAGKSENSYKSSYRTKEIDYKHMILAATGHDFLTSYNLVRNIWKNNLVEVDNRMKYVLELGSKQYMHELQSSVRGMRTS